MEKNTDQRLNLASTILNSINNSVNSLESSALDRLNEKLASGRCFIRSDMLFYREYDDTDEQFSPLNKMR